MTQIWLGRKALARPYKINLSVCKTIGCGTYSNNIFIGFMKESNTAVGYAVVYHALATIARDHGYALALHGSLLSDLDLIAVPWTLEATDEITLLIAIKEHLGLCDLLSDTSSGEKMTKKPHGRMAWKIAIWPTGSVDLSIIPRNSQ